MLTYIFLHTWGRLGSKEIFLLLCCFVLWIKETGLQRDLILASQVSNKQGEPFRKFLHQQGLSSEALRGTRIQAQPIVCRGKIPLPGPPPEQWGQEGNKWATCFVQLEMLKGKANVWWEATKYTRKSASPATYTALSGLHWYAGVLETRCFTEHTKHLGIWKSPQHCDFN